MLVSVSCLEISTVNLTELSSSRTIIVKIHCCHEAVPCSFRSKSDQVGSIFVRDGCMSCGMLHLRCFHLFSSFIFRMFSFCSRLSIPLRIGLVKFCTLGMDWNIQNAMSHTSHNSKLLDCGDFAIDDQDRRSRSNQPSIENAYFYLLAIILNFLCCSLYLSDTSSYVSCLIPQVLWRQTAQVSETCC